MNGVDRWAITTLSALGIGFTSALIAACLILEGGAA